MIGGAASYLLGSDFKPATEIYRGMPDHKKKDLATHVDEIMSNVPLETIGVALSYLSSHSDLKLAVKKEIDHFIHSQTMC